MVLIQAKPQMITLSDSAQDHFAKLVAIEMRHIVFDETHYALRQRYHL